MAKASTLVDDFNDDLVNTTLWTVTPSASDTVREVNGRVEIRPLSNAAAANYAYTSVSKYDLTESQVRVELVRALRPGRTPPATSSPRSTSATTSPSTWATVR